MPRTFWGEGNVCEGRVLRQLFYGMVVLVVLSSAAAAVSFNAPNQSDAAEPLDSQVLPVFDIQDEVVAREPVAAPDPGHRAFFGDRHVHTTYSFDASAMEVRR